MSNKRTEPLQDKGPVRASMGIRARLFLLFLIILLPILVIETYIYYQRFQNQKGNELQANLEVARAVARTFDAFVADILHTELAIGLAATASPSPSKDSLRKILQAAESVNPILRSFTWMSPEGIHLVTTNAKIENRKVGNWQEFQRAASSENWAISPIYSSPWTRDRVFTISRPIRDSKGKLLGVIACTAVADKLDSLLGIERAKGAGISLIDNKGIHVYRYPRTEYSEEQRHWLKIYPDMQESLKGKEILTTVVSESMGKKRLVAFTPVSSIAWVAAASRLQEDALAEFTSELLSQAVCVLLITLVGFGVALVFSRPISRSIIRLRNHALALGRGEVEKLPVDAGPGELKDLSAAFNRMAEEVKLRENALRESEQRWATTLASVGDAIITTDAAGKITFMNGVAEELTGWSLLHALTKPLPEVFNIINEETRQAVANPVSKVLEKENVVGLANHTTLVKKDGTEVPIDDSGAPIKDHDGKITGVVLVFRDITERREAEQALRASEAKANALIKCAPTGIYEIDYREPRLISINDAMCQILGYTREELLSINPSALLDESSRNRFADRVRRQLAGEKIEESVEFRVQKRDGSFIDAILNVSVNLGGNPNRALVVAHDITERKRMEEALKQSLEKQKTILQSITEGFVSFDHEWRYTFVNETAARILHKSPDELLGQICWEVFPEADAAGFGEFRRAVAENRFLLVEHFYPAPLNTWYECHCYPSPEGLSVFFGDVTERKQADARLAADLDALTRMHKLSEKLLEGGGIQPLLQEIMDAAVAIMGAKQGTLQLLEGDSLRIVAHYGHRQPFLGFFASAENRASVCGEATKRGERVIVPDVETSSLFSGTSSLPVLREAGVRAVQSTPMMSRKGVLLGILTAQWDFPHTPDEHSLWRIDLLTRQAADLIEYSRAEEALRQSENRLRRLYEAGLLGVIYWNTNGKITDANDKFLEMVGYDREDLSAGRIDWVHMTPPEYRHLDENAVRELRARGVNKEPFEKEYLRKDGKRIPVLIAGAMLDEARFNGVAFVLDVTERKQMEEDLRRSRDELDIRVQERTVELARANDELQREMARREKAEEQLRQAQKMEAIGTLTGGIAHDLNNILAPIVVNSELALFDLDGNPEIRSHLDLVLKSGLRGRELVRQLLLFSRKSEKKQEIVTLTPLVKDTFRLLRASIPATVQMKLHLETDSDAVYADPSQIQQVIMNLCTNAAYAMRGTTGAIDISLQGTVFRSDDLPDPDMTPGEYLVVAVKDTGCGMDEEVRKRIFEPFFTTKPTGEGTGLGLSVVYGIVKNHKGHITVYSEPGKGSIFKVYLPKVETEASEKGKTIKPIPKGDERILFVDDEEFILHSTTNMLQRLGYKVTAFQDSREALKVFTSDPSQFDLVMTDQTMPFMTGENLGKEIMQIRPDIPVILCTGYADLVSSEEAKEMAFRDSS